MSGFAVLQFVGTADDPRSCRFSQTMEQRLEKVFFEAQAKVFGIHSRLSVQVLTAVIYIYYLFLHSLFKASLFDLPTKMCPHGSFVYLSEGFSVFPQR